MIGAPEVIQGRTIGETHDMIICALIKKGCMNDMDTEDNEYTWEYPAPLIAHVIEPLQPPFVSEASDVGPKFLEMYREQLLSLTPPRADGRGFSYTYANRLFDYPRRIERTAPSLWIRPDIIGRAIGDIDNLSWHIAFELDVVGNGAGGGLNQIKESVIGRLKKSSVSRRAVAVTWVPEIDIYMDEPPCVDFIQFLLRDEVLRLVACIRSNDMLSAWPQNVYGLGGLLMYVGKELGVSTGPITTISISAHLYAQRDVKELMQFRAHLQKKGMLCERR